MQFIALIQEYWAIKNALRVLRNFELNNVTDEDLIYTTAAAIPQLEAALIHNQTQFAQLSEIDKRDVFSAAGSLMELSPQVQSIIENLKSYKKFKVLYEPLAKIFWKFGELLQTENKLIIGCDYNVKHKVEITKIIRHHFFMSEPINEDTNTRILSKFGSRRLREYLDLLRDYDPSKSSLRLMVAEALTFQNADDVANWLHAHIICPAFYDYFTNQLQVWSGHAAKWTELLNKIDQSHEKLDLSETQLSFLKEFSAGVNGSFQRIPRYGLFCNEFAELYQDAASSPGAMLKITEIATYLKKNCHSANVAIGEANVYEAFLSDLKKLQIEIDRQLKDYPKVSRFGLEYESVGQKFVKRTLRNGLLKIQTIVSDTFAQINKYKALQVNESTALECKILREDVCNDLRRAFHEWESELAAETYILPKVKDTALNEKLKPEILDFFKNCGISFEIMESLDDDWRLIK